MIMSQCKDLADQESGKIFGNENAILNGTLFTLDKTRVPIHSLDISIVKLDIDVAGAVKPNVHIFLFPCGKSTVTSPSNITNETGFWPSKKVVL
jgi:hypothetical protein